MRKRIVNFASIKTQLHNASIKKHFVKAAFLLFVLAGSFTFAYGAKEYGYYNYGYGQSELVLPHDLAKDLANNLSSDPYDPAVNHLIDRIADTAVTWGSRAISRVNLASMVVTYALMASQLQMNLATDVKNYHAYGFKMSWGVPYRVVQYPFDDYTLLKERSNPTVYVVIGDALFSIPDGSYFNYEWYRIRVVENGRLTNWFPFPKKYTFIKEVSNPTVWMIDYTWIDPRYTLISNQTQGWVRRPVKSYETITRMGKTWADVKVVPNGAFQRKFIPIGYMTLY